MAGSRKVKLQVGASRRGKYTLPDQHQLYVYEYCVDLDAKKACIRAGWAEKQAAGTANKLMCNPDVITAIRQQLGKRALETEIEAKRVLYELAMIAFADPAELFDDENGALLHIQDMPPEVRRSISSMDVATKESIDGSLVTTAKIKFWNKLDALNMIGKHLGILGSDVSSQHLHLHSEATNPYLNADPALILQAKEAMTRLEHSTKTTIENEVEQ